LNLIPRILLPLRFLSDKEIQERYVASGSQFGDAVSMLYMGECIGFEKMLGIWWKFEQEYAQRGYRTLSIDKFVEIGGYGKNYDFMLGQKREKDEFPVFHAELYRKNFLGKTTPLINPDSMNGEPQFGSYMLPSTENLDDQ